MHEGFLLIYREHQIRLNQTMSPINPTAGYKGHHVFQIAHTIATAASTATYPHASTMRMSDAQD